MHGTRAHHAVTHTLLQTQTRTDTHTHVQHTLYFCCQVLLEYQGQTLGMLEVESRWGNGSMEWICNQYTQTHSERALASSCSLVATLLCMCVLVISCIFIQVGVYAHAHTYTHIHMHMHMHTMHKHTYAHTYSHAPRTIHAHGRMHTHTDMHTTHRWAPDKAKETKLGYGTSSLEHPGGSVPWHV